MNFSKLKFKNKKILIYGLAKSGLAALEFLKKNKAIITCWDDDKSAYRKVKKKIFIIPKEQIKQTIF